MQQSVFDPQFAAGVTLAAEISKQLITVSAALIAVGVTFGNIVARNVRPRDLRVLYTAWIGYFFTIGFAVWHLSTLTGALLPIHSENSLRITTSRIPATLQLVSFVVANLLLVLFGFAAIRGRRQKRAARWPTENDQAL